MKKKILLGIGLIFGISALSGRYDFVSHASAEHLNQNGTYNYTTPSNASINSYGAINFQEGNNEILLDSKDIVSLQATITALFSEVDAYSGTNMAGK